MTVVKITSMCHKDIWRGGDTAPRILTSKRDMSSASRPVGFIHKEIGYDTPYTGRWVCPRTGV